MADFLSMLLQSAGSIAPEPQDDIIDVTTRALPPRTLAEDTRSAPSQNRLKELIPRKGLFGVKGTLRDVLGVVGDAFLVQGGGKPVYQPRRDQERKGDALYGYQDDPEGAIDRLAAAGYTDEAILLADQYAKRQKEQATIDSTNTKNTRDNFKEAVRIFGQYAGGATEKNYARIKPILEIIKTQGGLPDEFVVPEEYDPELLGGYMRGSMSTQGQANVDLGYDRLSQQEELELLKEKGRNQRYSPPQGRAAPNPTAASIAAPLLDKLAKGQQLTAGEMQVLRSTGFTPDRGKPARGQGTLRNSGQPGRRLRVIGPIGN